MGTAFADCLTAEYAEARQSEETPSSVLTEGGPAGEGVLVLVMARTERAKEQKCLALFFSSNGSLLHGHA